MAEYLDSRRRGDRREGRQLRSLPFCERVIPYVRRRRSESMAYVSEALEVTRAGQWIREKRSEGYPGLGLQHLMLAAYVRTVSMQPGINRFVCARRVFARNDIQVVLRLRRSSDAHAGTTAFKVSFSPSDTVYDVYRRLNDAREAVLTDVVTSSPERIAERLLKLPRPFLRLAMGILRILDYFDWLPRTWLEASPWHASLRLLPMDVLGIGPADGALADFGTVSSCLSFGARRRVRESDGDERQYVDYRIAVDSRIADSQAFSAAFRCLKYFLRNPALLELPPERVTDDIN